MNLNSAIELNSLFAFSEIGNNILIFHYCMKKRKHSFHILKVCEKNVSAFSCNSEVLQYQQIIHSEVSSRAKTILKPLLFNSFVVYI